MSRKIASHYALINGELERNIVIEVDDNHTIVGVERVDMLDSCACVEFYPGVLIPGMVNAHCHLELSYLRSAIEEGSGFAGFAREIGRVRGGYTDEERLRAAASADSVMWQEGVEAVVDVANDGLVMPVKQQSKIMYHTMYELFGLGSVLTNDYRNMVHNSCTAASITPHSTYSVQDATFRAICDEGSAPISLHFLESVDEAALYQGGGSLHEWYERMGWKCDFLHYKSPARRIVSSVPEHRRMILVHNCHATAEDVSLIENHFATPVTWVLCPESNRYISRSKPPVSLLRSCGVNVAIGTDSLASARTLSMVDNLRLIEDVPLNVVLTWATLGGARALGMEHTLGSFERGKRCGVVLIEGVDLQRMQLTSESAARRLL